MHWARALLTGWLLIFCVLAVGTAIVDWSLASLHPESWTIFGRALWVGLSVLWLAVGINQLAEDLP